MNCKRFLTDADLSAIIIYHTPNGGLRMRKILPVLLCFFLLMHIAGTVSAEPAETEDITASTEFGGSGYDSFDFLSDKNIDSYRSSTGDASITLTNKTGIAGLYLLFDLEYGSYTITDRSSGQTLTAGQQGFLHEYIDLVKAFGTAPTSVTLDFASGSVRLSEIYVFSGSDVPDFVQKWGAPLEGGADIVLFATHGDDDQLYFAGLLPLYAGARGCRVQVVYLTDHRNLTNARTHEMLNGLWSVGVSTYPVFGSFADFRIDDLEGSYAEYENTYSTSREELQGFVVEQLRRFKPLVAVGHDLQGEYGHGMHMVYADLLTKSIDLINDPEAFPESAEKYGTWELPKLYLHLYPENPITIDYDQPLDAFGGMTAFQVTQDYGFPCHKSQQWTFFPKWLYGADGQITKASEIEKYNPCEFGLFHSTVGEDVAKNDFLENVVTYAEQERLELERLEQERLEQERLEQERLEQEQLEQERLEQERLEQEQLEQEQIENHRVQAAEKRKRELRIAIILLCLLVVALACILAFRPRKRKGKK